MAVVVWNPTAFKAAYPEWTATADARTTALFDIAQYSLLDNTDGSPVMDVGYRTQLFYLLVAHLLTVFGVDPATTGPSNTPPGRLSSATEGTITVGYEYAIPQGSAVAPWYLQTKYGAMFWTATARFRSTIYASLGGSGTGAATAFGVLPVNLPGGI